MIKIMENKIIINKRCENNAIMVFLLGTGEELIVGVCLSLQTNL